MKAQSYVVSYVMLCTFLYIALLLCQTKRYYSLYPSLQIYPDNLSDAYMVQSYVDSRTYTFEQLFYLTDPSVSYAFEPYVQESIQDLDEIITRTHVLGIIYTAKYICNRARPKQVLPELQILTSHTADTPAYPAGHAFQAYYLANVLSKQYPQKKALFSKLAEDCALARVYAGIHYPSDNEFSKYLVSTFFSY